MGNDSSKKWEIYVEWAMIPQRNGKPMLNEQRYLKENEKQC